MRKILFLIALYTWILNANASENPNWSVSLIPAELKVKANAVVRLSETTITVLENSKTEESIHIVVTIMNENGDQFGNLVEYYDKYSSISGLDGIVYDQNGKKIRKIKQDEFLDYSAISGFSIYEDNRVKFASPKVGSYPYTVEYEYKKKHKKFMVLPGWTIYPYYNVSVQKSVFTLINDNKSKVFYKGNGKFSITPLVNEYNGLTTTRWNVENLTVLEDEPYSGDFSELTPQLFLAPEEFEMDGYKGTNKSWAEFGNWSSKLGQGRDSLSQPTIEKIRTITANAKTDTEKAKLLYEFMQNKVRYVSIQAGIGGWQPFPAETVDRLSYGDCKALANYMQAILRVAGIKSYYCLVRAGAETSNMKKDFVCSQFNHAFLMLPVDHDTIFLECTSQIDPFGYNGTFTDDRDIVVVDGMNSHIKHTNIYTRKENQVLKTVNIKIDNKLNCKVEQINKYVGVATEDRRFLMQEKPEKQREIVLRDIEYKQVKLNNLNYLEHKDIIPVIDERFSYDIAAIAQLTSSKTMIIPFNQVSVLSDLKRVSNRKSDVIIRRDEIEIDTINYVIPQGIIVDKLPISGSFRSIFGSYKLDVSSVGNQISFIRTLTWDKCEHKPEKYIELMQYQKKVNEMDRQVMILKPV